MALRDEKRQRGKVGGGIDDFGGCVCRQEIVTVKTDEHEGQQTARARPEDAVVKPDERAE